MPTGVLHISPIFILQLVISKTFLDTYDPFEKLVKHSHKVRIFHEFQRMDDLNKVRGIN